MKNQIFLAVLVILLIGTQIEAHSLLRYNVSIDMGYDLFEAHEGKFKIRIGATMNEKFINLSPNFQKILPRRVYHYSLMLPFTMDEVKHVHITWVKKPTSCNCPHKGYIKVTRVILYPTYVRDQCSGKPKTLNFCIPKSRQDLIATEEVRCETKC